jgi:hypothetical protein
MPIERWELPEKLASNHECSSGNQHLPLPTTDNGRLPKEGERRRGRQGAPDRRDTRGSCDGNNIPE